MKLNELSLYIDELIKDRFVKEENQSKSTEFLDLDEYDLSKKVIRLKRSFQTNLLFYRTLLLVEINDVSFLKEALKWTSAVKNNLTDPETSDLYLIIVSGNNIYSTEDSMRIEATEQFCKKYVQRNGEIPECLMKRTYLSKLSFGGGNAIQGDPLKRAFQNTNTEHAWFDAEKQRVWEDAFTSDDNGNELLDKIQ
jgi:hypothetical protein